MKSRDYQVSIKVTENTLPIENKISLLQLPCIHIHVDISLPCRFGQYSKNKTTLT